MATDMGGFAQAGGPYLIDRFGRRLTPSPSLIPPNGFRRIDALTAFGGENYVILKAAPVANSIAITVNGIPVPWTISGNNITLTTSLSAGQICLVDYMATTPNPAATVISSLDTTAISIYGSLIEWFGMNDTGSGGLILGSFAGIVLASTVPTGAFLQPALCSSGSGHCVDFNFSGGNYFAYNTSTGVDFTAGAGISMFGWFKSSSLSSISDGALFGGAYNGTYALVYNMYGNASLALAYYTSGMTWYTNPSTSLADGVAAHVGYTLDFTTRAVNWYINGASIASATLSSLTNATNKNSIEIGSWSANPGGRRCYGSLQDIVMCNKALSSTEAAYLYQSGAGISFAQLKSNSGN